MLLKKRLRYCLFFVSPFSLLICSCAPKRCVEIKLYDSSMRKVSNCKHTLIIFIRRPIDCILLSCTTNKQNMEFLILYIYTIHEMVAVYFVFSIVIKKQNNMSQPTVFECDSEAELSLLPPDYPNF